MDPAWVASLRNGACHLDEALAASRAFCGPQGTWLSQPRPSAPWLAPPRNGQERGCLALPVALLPALGRGAELPFPSPMGRNSTSQDSRQRSQGPETPADPPGGPPLPAPACYLLPQFTLGPRACGAAGRRPCGERPPRSPVGSHSPLTSDEDALPEGHCTAGGGAEVPAPPRPVARPRPARPAPLGLESRRAEARSILARRPPASARTVPLPTATAHAGQTRRCAAGRIPSRCRRRVLSALEPHCSCL